MSDDSIAINDPFSATALDEATELRALAQALRLAQGFKLIFVRCNQQQQRRNLIAALRTQLPELNAQEIHFDKPITHLLDELRSRIAEPPPDAVFVSGLESSLPVAADADATPLVANLNASRNSFPQVIPCPLVLWIPEYILNAIMLGAPDFFSIRSGVYFFAASPSDTTELASSLIAGAEWASDSLSLTEKKGRIEAIESLLADYESLPDSSRDYQTEVELHWRLGNLFSASGNLSLAQKHYEQILALAKKLEKPVWERMALSGLGYVYRYQGRFAEAEKTFHQVLELSRESGNRSAEGTALGNLANIYIEQGRLEEAEKLYQQALEIFRVIGDHVNEGQILSNLGIIYGKQNRLDEAGELLQKSLEISRKVENRINQMNALLNLGNVYLTQGRLTEAENLYRESLTISREVGDPFAEASTLNNLGNSCKEQQQLSEAEMFYQESLAISERVGDYTGQGDTLAKLALLWAERGDFEEARKLAQRAIEVLQKTEDERGLAVAQLLLAELEREIEKQQLGAFNLRDIKAAS